MKKLAFFLKINGFSMLTTLMALVHSMMHLGQTRGAAAPFTDKKEDDEKTLHFYVFFFFTYFFVMHIWHLGQTWYAAVSFRDKRE